jgi:hypothetical protein
MSARTQVSNSAFCGPYRPITTSLLRRNPVSSPCPSARLDRTRDLRRVTARWKAADLLAALKSAGIPSGLPVNDYRQVFADPKVVQRGMALAVKHAQAGPTQLCASPSRFVDVEALTPMAPPVLGPHMLPRALLGDAPSPKRRAGGAAPCEARARRFAADRHRVRVAEHAAGERIHARGGATVRSQENAAPHPAGS